MGIGLSSVANHGLSFTDPIDFLHQLEKLTGLPYFVGSLGSAEKPAIHPPDGFKGFCFYQENWPTPDSPSFDLFQEKIDSIYISTHCFSGGCPVPILRWRGFLAVMFNEKYQREDLQDNIDDFMAQRKAYYAFIRTLKGNRAIYCCDHSIDIWEDGIAGKTMEEVIALAKEKFLVYYYPEDVAMLHTLRTEEVWKRIVIVDTFLDLNEDALDNTS